MADLRSRTPDKALLEGLLREALEGLEALVDDPRDPAIRTLLRRMHAALAMPDAPAAAMPREGGEDALRAFVARIASARCNHDADECERWIHEARALMAASSGSGSSPSAEPPRAVPTAALHSDGRGDAVCGSCGAVIECRHDQKYKTDHRPDCPLVEAR